MQTKLNVVVLSHTPEFEQNIVRGARLCYSSASIEDLKEKVTPEDAEKFLNKILEIGHGSILEHSSITFGIEGVSRALTHQLVRHRIGTSFSQKSQRYVREGQFDYVIPKPIQKDPELTKKYIESMERIQADYDMLTNELLVSQIKEQVNLKQENYNKLFAEYVKANEAYEGMTQLNDIINTNDNENILTVFKAINKREYTRLEKIAIENARYVLPNACESKIQVTMNVRSLFNFFKERLCDRAQEEIREMAFEMWKCCMQISPTIFKHATPTCVNGKCKEGAMTCGKMLQYKDKYNNAIKEFI